MQALTLPANRGWFWLAEGFRLFRKRPVHLSFLVMSYRLIWIISLALPLIGQSIVFLTGPSFSVSLMNACRKADTSQILLPNELFSGFKKNAKVLLVQGLIHLVIAILIFALAKIMTDDLILSATANQAGELAVSLRDLTLADYLITALFLPVAMAFWFSPVLSAWHDLPAVKAIFFSFIACLRNWRAFVVYFMVSGLIIVFFVALFNTATPLFGDFFSLFMLSLFLFVFLPIMSASVYVSYQEIFISVDENI